MLTIAVDLFDAYLFLLVGIPTVAVVVGVLSLLLPARCRGPVRAGLRVTRSPGVGIPAVRDCGVMFLMWWRAYAARRSLTGRVLLAVNAPYVLWRLLTFRVRPATVTLAQLDAAGRPRAGLAVHRRRVRGGWQVSCVAADLPGAGADLVELVARRAGAAGVDVWLKASNAAVADKVYAPMGFHRAGTGLRMVLRAKVSTGSASAPWGHYDDEPASALSSSRTRQSHRTP